MTRKYSRFEARIASKKEWPIRTEGRNRPIAYASWVCCGDCSSRSRWEAGGSIDVVDHAHIDDALAAVGWKFRFAANRLDECAQLICERRVARHGLVLFAGARLHRELMTPLRRDRIYHPQFSPVATRHEGRVDH